MQRDQFATVTPVLEETQPAVSWSAVFAGAIASLAVALVLTSLATGFGLKLPLPWLASRDSLSVFTPAFGAWVIAVQVLSAGLGGYLAGRLRAQWLNVHRHEVHFRDTAHGLLVWAVGTVAGVVLAASVLGPYAERMNPPAAVAEASASAGADEASAVAAVRRANVTAEAAFFLSFGLLLSAFTASVAAALGGIRRDEMYAQP